MPLRGHGSNGDIKGAWLNRWGNITHTIHTESVCTVEPLNEDTLKSGHPANQDTSLGPKVSGLEGFHCIPIESTVKYMYLLTADTLVSY